MRIETLDGFRGFFLFFMMIIHVNVWTGVTIGKVNHHYFGWVEDAQGFVFISGFVVALVYGRLLTGSDPSACRRAVWARARTIYGHHAFLVACLLLASLAATLNGVSPQVLRPFQEAPLAMALASLGLVGAARDMGILPMYIWFMLITPLVLAALRRGYGPWLAALSIAAWLLAQTGAMQAVLAMSEDRLAAAGHPVRLGLFFNLLGWQLLFFGGIGIGYRHLTRRIDLSGLTGRTMQRAFWAGLALVVAFGIFDRIVFNDLFGAAFSAAALEVIDRGNLSTLYVATFVLDLCLLAWLLSAGAGTGSRAIRVLAASARVIFANRAFVFLGRHSLHVFTAHILFVYAVAVWVDLASPGQLARNLALLASPLVLFAVASWHESSGQRSRAGRVRTTVGA